MRWVWRWPLLLVALGVMTSGLPVPDENVDTSTEVLGSSVVTSVSVVMGDGNSSAEKGSDKSGTKKVTNDLPASTVDMLKPDGFQFYTVDEKGQLITRQMTDSEIQSIIAAGGGPFPIETQDPEKAEENMTGEMKVADVVQNVQNVLKEELNKPATVMGTVPTIPGHANDEWSSILPSILGGEADSAPVTVTEADMPVLPVLPDPETKVNISMVVKKPETPEVSAVASPQEEIAKPSDDKKQSPTSSLTSEGATKPVKEDSTSTKKPEEEKERHPVQQKPSEKPEENPERPMIPVPVITADSSHSTMEDPSTTESKPVYQILNTLSADEVKNEAEKTESSAVPEKESEIPKEELKKPEVLDGLPAAETPSMTTPKTIEMEVTSSFVSVPQKDSEKPMTASDVKVVEEVADSKPIIAPQATPSITLEAPAPVPEAPVKIMESVEKPTQDTLVKITEFVEKPEQNVPVKVVESVEEPTQNSPPKIMETVEQPAQIVPVKVMDPVGKPTQDVPVKVMDPVEEPTQDVPVKIMEPVGEPAQNVPVKIMEPVEKPTQDAPVKVMESAEQPAQDVPVKVMEPVGEPAQDVPVKIMEPVEQPTQDDSVKVMEPAEQPAQDVPVKIMEPVEQPTQDDSVKVMEPAEQPAQDVPVKIMEPVEQPTQDDSVKVMEPAEQPAQHVPVKLMEPVEKPTQNVPVKITEPAEKPAQDVPVKIMEPVEQPAQDVPVKVMEPAEKPAQDIPVEVAKPVEKPSIESHDKEPFSTPEATISTMTAMTMEQEMVNMLPQSIDTIVKELISENANDMTKETTDNVEPEKVSDSATVPAPAKPLAPEPVMIEDTKMDEADMKDTVSIQKVGETAESATKKPETSGGAEIPLMAEWDPETLFQMLPEITPEPTTTKIVPESPAPTEKVEDVDPEKTKTRPEISETPEMTENLLPVELQAPATVQLDAGATNKVETIASSGDENNDSVTKTPMETGVKSEPTAATEKKPETMLNELADSVSSMISQISETMTSMVPIPEKSENKDEPVKRVEDGLKEEATMVKVEVPEPMTTVTSEETKPAVLEIPNKEDIVKPETTAVEIKIATIKEPGPVPSDATNLESNPSKTSEVASTEPEVKIDFQKPEIPVKNMGLPVIDAATPASADAPKTEAISEDGTNPNKAETTSVVDDKTDIVKASVDDPESMPIKPEAGDVMSAEALSNPVEKAKPEVVVGKVEVMMNDGSKKETAPESNAPSDIETPIVRIDIDEAKPTDSLIMDSPSPTESPFVRIQMMNPIATINQMIDTAPAQDPSIVKVQPISFNDKDIQTSPPQNIGSDLIAGSQPTKPTEVTTPEDLYKPKVVPVVNELPENTASADQEVTKSELEMTSSINSKPTTEIKPITTSDSEAVQAEGQPLEANKNEKPEAEILKTTEELMETKPEIQDTEDTAASSEDVTKLEAPVQTVVMIESSEKTPEKLVDEDVPTVSTDISAMVPPEVIISTTVEVEPAKDLPEKKPELMKDDAAKPQVPEAKPEMSADSIETSTDAFKTTSEVKEDFPSDKTESKPETVAASETTTKTIDSPSDSIQDPMTVEEGMPLATQVSAQKPGDSSDVSTPVTNGDKMPEKTESDGLIEEIQTLTTPASKDGSPLEVEASVAETIDVKPDSEMSEVKVTEDLPAESEGNDVVQDMKEFSEPLANPELVLTPEQKPSSNEMQNSEPTLEEKPSSSELEKPVLIAAMEKEPSSNKLDGSEQVLIVKKEPSSNESDKPELIAPAEKTSVVSESGKLEPVSTLDKKPSSGDKDVSDDTSSTQANIEKLSVPVVSPEKPDEKPVVTEAANEQEFTKPTELLVKVDVTSEKIKPEDPTDSSMAMPATEKLETVSESVKIDDMKTVENPEKITMAVETPVAAMNSPEKPQTNSPMENTEIQPAEPESTILSDSLSKAPASPEIQMDEVQTPAASKPQIPMEEEVKKTANKVETKLPEVATSPATKVKTPETMKPVLKIETTPLAAPENSLMKTQEVRVQVNETAVRVTKRPVPQEDSKVSENEKEKVKPTSAMDSVITTVEVSSQPIEATKAPSVEKPASVTESQQKPQVSNEKSQVTDTATREDVTEIKEKVKDSELGSVQKKPVADPYLKLGEAQKQKPDNNAKPTNLENKKAETEEKWSLIPQSTPYPILKQTAKPIMVEATSNNKNDDESQQVSVTLEAHQSAVNLDESTRQLDKDIGMFSALCNELAFSFWTATNKGLSTARSLALSPFGMTSMLAMMFLGARGPTSGQMNDILKLDDVVTFNPHLVFQNVTDSVNLARGQGIANAAFVRELFADRTKAGKLLPFYKERAQQFYDGHIEEVNFAAISDLVRRRTNLLIRRQTGGRIRDFVKGNVMPLRSPLAALSANVFQTDCTGASSEGRDGEMYFAVLPAVRQRKLIPVPATVWRSGVLAGYEPGLDATVISLGGVSDLVSTIFLLPGQQGLAAPGDSLDHLERRLIEGAFTQGTWKRLLKVLIPRMGLEVQVPKFSHRSIVNATAALKRMGLDDLFSIHADLKGINGVGNDLHLADMVQINLFSTCGDEAINGGRHHIEIYPAGPLRGARGEKNNAESRPEDDEVELEPNEDILEHETRSRRSVNVAEYVEEFHDTKKRSVSQSTEGGLVAGNENSEERSERASSKLREPLGTKAKQASRPLLKLDRPFLYFVRHNPTGMILHMGRFNPRLMP
ncbi:titin [Diprion similis]|uniref:titin n=1 Tax=Diprion similis TaxID=362088 RepID=UPI001EF7D6BA|nr:titin [Diprion similis]XP_046739936.1 titin [Diprion similis]XP_046739937.1 titin [Diprion similis]